VKKEDKIRWESHTSATGAPTGEMTMPQENHFSSHTFIDRHEGEVIFRQCREFSAWPIRDGVVIGLQGCRYFGQDDDPRDLLLNILSRVVVLLQVSHIVRHKSAANRLLLQN